MATYPFPILVSQQDIEDYLSVSGVGLRIDDTMVGAPDATGTRRVTHSRIAASETCYYYLYAKYDPNNLVQSFLLNLWATWLGAYWLCGCRGVTVPAQLAEDVGGAEDKLKDIQAGRTFLPGIPLRRQQAPVWDNVRLCPWNNFRVIRIEKSRSSTQPMNIPLSIDYQDAYLGAFEI